MKRRLAIALGIASLCALAVVLLGRLKAADPAHQGHSVQFWVRELAAREPRRQKEATAAFQALGTNAVPALSKLVCRHDSRLRQKAWDWAGKLPSSLGNPVRRQVGPLDATTLRANAARALALLGPQAQAAAPALSQALHDADINVRYQAGQALGQIGAAGVPALVAAAQDPHSHVRYCAVAGLGYANKEAAPLAVPALFQALADPDSTVSSWAGQSLAKLGTNAAPFLSNMVVQADAPTRQRAAKALGSVRYHSWAVPPLVQLLHDPEPACRTVAVQALAGLGLPDRAMLGAYLEALQDPELSVRLGAVQGLGQARSQARSIVPVLAGCLEDGSPAVREAAARALGHFGPQAQPASTNLTRLLTDPEEAVRAAAREALDKLK